MDNKEDKSRLNRRSVREVESLRSDPIIQARDYDDQSGSVSDSTDIIPVADSGNSVVSGKLVPRQFMAADQPMRSESSGTNILMSTLRYKWSILIVAVLVTVPAVIAIWTQVVPKYRTKAEIRVRPIVPRLVFRTEDNGAIPFYQSFVNTQVSIIRSFDVLQRALEQQEVQDTKWYKSPPLSFVQKVRGSQPIPPIERLREDFTVEPRRKTEIIDVIFVDTSKSDAKVIVNFVLEQYIKYIGEMSNATSDVLYRQLVDQYKSLENEILGRGKVIAELRKTLGTNSPEELISAKRVRLDELQARFNELQQSIEIAEWEINELYVPDVQEAVEGGDDVSVPDTEATKLQPRYFEDDRWVGLDMNLRSVQHKIDKSSFTAKHPEMIQLASDLKFAKELLQLRQAQLDEQWANRPVFSSGPYEIGNNNVSYQNDLLALKHQISRAKQEQKLLFLEIEKQQAEFGKLFESAQLLEKENGTLLHKRELFSTVRQRLDQKNMERNVPGSIEVLTWAFTPSEPYKDRRIVFSAMALVFGLGLGGGIAFLRASTNQVIYSADDMPHQMQDPFLGHMPISDSKASSDKGIGCEVATESVRFIRTALLSRIGVNSNAAIQITSSEAGTGKSSFTLMLGKSLAHTGSKILMIDGDFRKKTLTKRLGLFGKPGFIQFLCSKSVDKKDILAMKTPGLSVLAAGMQSAGISVSEVMANGAFKACIKELRKEYDIILIDNCPITAMADAAIISNQVDGTIMVERESVSRRFFLYDALVRLNTVGGNLLGTVFVGSSDQKKYGYGY